MFVLGSLSMKQIYCYICDYCCHNFIAAFLILTGISKVWIALLCVFFSLEKKRRKNVELFLLSFPMATFTRPHRALTAKKVFLKMN